MNKMSKFLTSSLLGVSLVFALTGLAFAWGNPGGDGSSYNQIQEKIVVFNNSGGTLVSGQVVVLDRTGTGVTAGTTLGAYVTTTTSADSIEVVGVLDRGTTCPNQTPCTVITKGPAEVWCQDTGDAVSTGSAVGTTGSGSIAGRCGGGSKLGTALEAGSGSDGDLIWIWVNPTNGD